MKTTGMTRNTNGITRFDPWREMMEGKKMADHLINRGFRFTPLDLLTGSGQSSPPWMPNITLYETPENFVFTADLPGFSKEEIDLIVTEENIQLSASPEGKSQGGQDDTSTQTPQETPPSDQEQRVYHILGQERRNFSVSYRLPSEINPEHVQASYKNGVLEVQMPKAQPVQSRQIRIEVTGGANGWVDNALSTGESEQGSPLADQNEQETSKRSSRRKSS